MAVVYYNKQAGFEIAHGVLDRIMQLLEVKWKTGYHLKHINGTHNLFLIFSNYPLKILLIPRPTFMPGRCAAIHVNGKVIGTVGVIHPDVIHNFELNLPCCALEINIEPF